MIEEIANKIVNELSRLRREAYSFEQEAKERRAEADKIERCTRNKHWRELSPLLSEEEIYALSVYSPQDLLGDGIPLFNYYDQTE